MHSCPKVNVLNILPHKSVDFALYIPHKSVDNLANIPNGFLLFFAEVFFTKEVLGKDEQILLIYLSFIHPFGALKCAPKVGRKKLFIHLLFSKSKRYCTGLLPFNRNFILLLL